jgi:hypothetical protein
MAMDTSIICHGIEEVLVTVLNVSIQLLASLVISSPKFLLFKSLATSLTTAVII